MINQKRLQRMGKEIQQILAQMLREGHFKPIHRTLRRYLGEGQLEETELIRLGFILDLAKTTPRKTFVVQRSFLAQLTANMSRRTGRPEFLGKTLNDIRNAVHDPTKKARLLGLLKSGKPELAISFALDDAKTHKPCEHCKGTGIHL